MPLGLGLFDELFLALDDAEQLPSDRLELLFLSGDWGEAAGEGVSLWFSVGGDGGFDLHVDRACFLPLSRVPDDVTSESCLHDRRVSASLEGDGLVEHGARQGFGFAVGGVKLEIVDHERFVHSWGSVGDNVDSVGAGCGFDAGEVDHGVESEFDFPTHGDELGKDGGAVDGWDGVLSRNECFLCRPDVAAAGEGKRKENGEQSRRHDCRR